MQATPSTTSSSPVLRKYFQVPPVDIDAYSGVTVPTGYGCVQQDDKDRVPLVWLNPGKRERGLALQNFKGLYFWRIDDPSHPRNPAACHNHIHIPRTILRQRWIVASRLIRL